MLCFAAEADSTQRFYGFTIKCFCLKKLLFKLDFLSFFILAEHLKSYLNLEEQLIDVTLDNYILSCINKGK